MEDNSQPISRLKQYYVVRDHSEKDIGHWEKGSVIELDPDVAIPYVGAGILVPLASAIATGLIPTASSSSPNPLTAAPQREELPTPEAPKKKTLIKSSLKEAVAEKKADIAPVEEVILTPSNAPQPAETPEPTAQEQAIKAKIAALKKNKS